MCPAVAQEKAFKRRCPATLFAGGASTGRAGFTLIEILVVMVLMTVVTAFALPSLRSALFTDQLKATARRLVGLISEAGQQAVGRPFPTELHFDFENNRVWLNTGGKTTDRDKPDGVRQQVNMPDGISLVDVHSAHGGKNGQGTAVVRFSAKGYVDRTYIHLRSDDGRDMTLMLSPFLAVIKVEDSYVELDDGDRRY